MPGGYHRLSSRLMEERDNLIIRLVKEGYGHRIIAGQARLAPTGLETRLKKLRLEGRLPLVGGCNG